PRLPTPPHSLHDALPISASRIDETTSRAIPATSRTPPDSVARRFPTGFSVGQNVRANSPETTTGDTPATRVLSVSTNPRPWRMGDRKSTRLNSSHLGISY